MKEKLKVYHGLPKTPIDSNTVFYSSFDGSIRAELGGEPTFPNGGTTNQLTFSPGITGYKLNSTINTKFLRYQLPYELTDEYCFDAIVYYDGGTTFRRIVKLGDACIDLMRYGADFTVGYRVEGNSSPVRIRVGKLVTGYNHVRVTGNRTKICSYINGKIVSTLSVSNIRWTNCNIIDISETTAGEMGGYTQDLHISDIDRKDVFLTLPKDFIDGKAIISPILNHRQSYGDPFLHQITNLYVPAQLENEKGKYYSTIDKDTDGYFRCLANPELTVLNAHNWVATNGKLRISIISGECVTGVFDTDTAKCRIVKNSTNTKLVYVDTVSGISVGDKLNYLYNRTYLGDNDYNYTVEAIDATNNTLTMSHTTNWYAGDYFVETTASSSLPLVKTVDGTIVNGTWSGLGTRNATFTFGTNSDIAGKDLIVTYCLTGLGSMSPYPKMPSEVIRGFDEVGNELKSVSSLVVKDDFKSKTSGELSNCPHKLYYALESTLQKPNGTWKEFSSQYYNFNGTSIASPVQGHFAQILVEVDLAELVERKLGEKIPGDKVMWLNDNIKTISCYALASGENNTNTNSYIKYYNPSKSSWTSNSTGCSSTSSKITRIASVIGPVGSFLNSTKYYFLIHSDALSVQGNDDTKARIKLQDVQLEIQFNTDSRFDYLYTMEHYVSESVCNPIIIDKQTLEVSRLLPSKNPFATEVIVHNPTTRSTRSSEVMLCQSPHGLITTQGSGSSIPTTDVLRGLINKLGISGDEFLNEPIVDLPVNGFSQKSARNTFVHRQYYPSQLDCYEPKELPNLTVNSVFLCWDIIKFEGELYLKVLIYRLNPNKDTNLTPIIVKQYYQLPNRPLVK